MNTLTNTIWTLTGMVYAFTISSFIVSNETEKLLVLNFELATAIAMFSTLLFYSIKVRRQIEKERMILEKILKEVLEKEMEVKNEVTK